MGSGSQITEEAITTVDEGKMGMYKIYIIINIRELKSIVNLFLLFFCVCHRLSILPNNIFNCNFPSQRMGEISYLVELFGYFLFKPV